MVCYIFPFLVLWFVFWGFPFSFSDFFLEKLGIDVVFHVLFIRNVCYFPEQTILYMLYIYIHTHTHTYTYIWMKGSILFWYNEIWFLQSMAPWKGSEYVLIFFNSKNILFFLASLRCNWHIIFYKVKCTRNWSGVLIYCKMLPP